MWTIIHKESNIPIMLPGGDLWGLLQQEIVSMLPFISLRGCRVHLHRNDFHLHLCIYLYTLAGASKENFKELRRNRMLFRDLAKSEPCKYLYTKPLNVYLTGWELIAIRQLLNRKESVLRDEKDKVPLCFLPRVSVIQHPCQRLT